MKKLISVLIFSIVFLITACSVAFWGISAEMPDLTIVTDGVYRGNYTVGPARAALDVIVQNHRIIRIEIIEPAGNPGNSPARKIINQIIKRQSLNIDAVTGATATSKAVLKAVENALR